MNQVILNRQYKAHTGNIGVNGNPPEFHFKRIGNNLCDVFTGEGFDTPTRYRLIKGTWVYLHGPRLDASVASSLPV